MVMEAVKALSAEEITDLCLRHTLYDWGVQKGLKPLPVTSAKGVHFHTADGRRFIDFNSQLMSVNAGHGERRIIDAIKRQAETLPYISPFMAHEARARLGAKLAELLPGDIDKVFFTLGGAESNENAIKIARAVTGRPKVLARYRSYHGSTGTAIQATGDPRRWPNEGAGGGVVHVLDPYHGIQRGWDTVEEALANLEEVIQLEGPSTIAAFLLEPITGTNGILIPPDGYLQGVRALCDRHGILMICDEVMTGFGRTGTLFAWEQAGTAAPDLLCLSKGITGGYLPLSVVLASDAVYAAFYDEQVSRGFLHSHSYTGNALACRAALAVIDIFREDGVIDANRAKAARWDTPAASLAAHRRVRNFRHRGMIWAFEVDTPRPDFARWCFAEGLKRELLLRPIGNTLYFMPPYIVTDDEFALLVERTLAILDRLDG
jgi:taurine--2-oxoglutarate transaminase